SLQRISKIKDGTARMHRIDSTRSDEVISSGGRVHLRFLRSYDCADDVCEPSFLASDVSEFRAYDRDVLFHVRRYPLSVWSDNHLIRKVRNSLSVDSSFIPHHWSLDRLVIDRVCASQRLQKIHHLWLCARATHPHVHQAMGGSGACSQIPEAFKI